MTSRSSGRTSTRSRAACSSGCIGGGGELVTLVAGAEAGDLAQACEAWVERAHPGVDVVVYEGGQDRYPLLVAVE